MKRNKILQKLRNKRPKELDKYLEISDQIAEYINDLLENKKISKSKFAEILKKDPSEISKYLSGQQNFTLKTLAKISVILNEDIIITPKQAQKQYNNPIVFISAKALTMYPGKYYEFSSSVSRQCSIINDTEFCYKR